MSSQTRALAKSTRLWCQDLTHSFNVASLSYQISAIHTREINPQAWVHKHRFVTERFGPQVSWT